MKNNNAGRLTLVMRLAEEREIVNFELEEGETLSQRVKEEISKAIESGDIKGLASRAGLPVVAVRESTEDGTGINSVALFTAEGEDISDRSAVLSMEDEMYLLTGTDNDNKTLLGAFPDEDIAKSVGVLWKAGLI